MESLGQMVVVIRSRSISAGNEAMCLACRMMGGNFEGKEIGSLNVEARRNATTVPRGVMPSLLIKF
jgi:hypothetical protein